MIKILIIEDERDLAELIAFNLEQDGYQAIIAGDGKTGLERIQNDRPDLVVLDLMLPEIGGIDICRAVRQNPATAHTPIIMVTARGEEIDRVVGFEVGADDYLVKPFSTRELLLRIKSILKRSAIEKPEQTILTCGPITIDSSSHKVMVDTSEVSLTITEFKLLLIFMERLGRIQSREQLLSDIWGYSSDADTRTVDTHITRLRNKLGGAGDLVRTVRGFGYRMDTE